MQYYTQAAIECFKFACEFLLLFSMFRLTITTADWYSPRRTANAADKEKYKREALEKTDDDDNDFSRGNKRAHKYKFFCAAS